MFATEIAAVEALRGSILIAHEQLRCVPPDSGKNAFRRAEAHCVREFWPVVRKCCVEALKAAADALHDKEWDTCLNLLRLLEAILTIDVGGTAADGIQRTIRVTKDPVAWLCVNVPECHETLKTFEHDSIRLLREFEERRAEATGWTGTIPLAPVSHHHHHRISPPRRSPPQLSGAATRQRSPPSPPQQQLHQQRRHRSPSPASSSAAAGVVENNAIARHNSNSRNRRGGSDEEDDVEDLQSQFPIISDKLPPIEGVRDYTLEHAPPVFESAEARRAAARRQARLLEKEQQEAAARKELAAELEAAAAASSRGHHHKPRPPPVHKPSQSHHIVGITNALVGGGTGKPPSSASAAAAIAAAQQDADEQEAAAAERSKRDLKSPTSSSNKSPRKRSPPTHPSSGGLGQNVTPDGRTIGFAPKKLPSVNHPWFARYASERRHEHRPFLASGPTAVKQLEAIARVEEEMHNNSGSLNHQHQHSHSHSRGGRRRGSDATDVTREGAASAGSLDHSGLFSSGELRSDDDEINNNNNLNQDKDDAPPAAADFISRLRTLDLRFGAKQHQADNTESSPVTTTARRVSAAAAAIQSFCRAAMSRAIFHCPSFVSSASARRQFIDALAAATAKCNNKFDKKIRPAPPPNVPTTSSRRPQQHQNNQNQRRTPTSPNEQQTKRDSAQEKLEKYQRRVLAQQHQSPESEVTIPQQHLADREKPRRIPFSVLVDTLPLEDRAQITWIRKKIAARVIMTKALKVKVDESRAWQNALLDIAEVQDLMAAHQARRKEEEEKQKQKQLREQLQHDEEGEEEQEQQQAADLRQNTSGEMMNVAAAVAVDKQQQLSLSIKSSSNNNKRGSSVDSSAAASAAGRARNDSNDRFSPILISADEFEQQQSFSVKQHQQQTATTNTMATFEPLKMVSLHELEAKRARVANEAARLEAEREERRRLAILAHREELNRQILAVRLIQRAGRGMLRRAELGSQRAAWLLTGQSFARLNHVVQSAMAARAAVAVREEDVWEEAHRAVMRRVLQRHPEWEVACYQRKRRALLRGVTLVQAMLRWHATVNVVDYLRLSGLLEIVWMEERASLGCTNC